MCAGCWAGMDHPKDPGPNVDRVLHLIAELYKIHPTGGPLHCELDDWNLDAEVITPMYAIPARGGYPGHPDDYSPEIHAVCDELAALLTEMTLDQRYAVLAFNDGFLARG